MQKTYLQAISAALQEEMRRVQYWVSQGLDV